MEKVITKHGPFQPEDVMVIPGKVVEFYWQNHGIYIWAETGEYAEEYQIVATGQPYNDKEHVDTCHSPGGFVWHLVK